MLKTKRKLHRAEKTSFCPDCGKRFVNETQVLQHMNQPSIGCGSWINDLSHLDTPNTGSASLPTTGAEFFPQSQHQPEPYANGFFDEEGPDVPAYDEGASAYHSERMEQAPADGSVTDFYPGAPELFPRGTTFMNQFFSNQYASVREENLYYPFASNVDWQLASWLLCLRLSMAAIDGFLSLELIKQLPISFQSAKELRLRAEMLPSGPHWKSHTFHPPTSTKRKVVLYYRDAVDCLQALLSHPLFAAHISFILKKEWLSGNHAWDLQGQIPDGATLLGVVLSSDKTNISVMTGNQMAHPLLLSLANINADICSKGSLHGHVLLALLPVASFIHKKTRVCSLLSDQLVHKSLDFILKPLKVAAAVGIMMSDPVGNLRYCFTPLVTYITNTPEESLLACIGPKASPVSAAIYKQFGDDFCHPPHHATQTLADIEAVFSRSDPDDYEYFLKVTKLYRLNGVHKPFWRDWPMSDPSIFLMPEPLHHFHHMFWDHDLQWCINIVGEAESDYRFSISRHLLDTARRDHRAVQRYIVGVIAGTVPSKFLAAICALLDFQYLGQMPRFDDDTLARVSATLHSFHDNKKAIITAGSRRGTNGPMNHWEIPKLELLQHIVPSIRTSGAVMQWTADVTEHAHVTEIKQPARAGNNQDYYSQIACHLDRSEKCSQFDLATHITSIEEDPKEGDAEDEEHEPEPERLHLAQYYTPTRKVIDYFEIAEALVNSAVPDAPRPYRTFASSSTAICLAVKPSLRMSIEEAAETFGLPDLRPAISNYHMPLSTLGRPVRKAVTQTPLKFRTTSVPTTGKIFKAAEINNELVELNGATLKEDPLQNSQDHYIIDQCDKSSPSTSTYLPPIKDYPSLKCDNQPLYIANPPCWEPTTIPHILRA
ncbi:hypothetical protein PAXINDRAFT_11002 [Paxillus involutus ATCC 200175]|nr:hypothetical protein PAXINDRAFT_11002 [Paxillus involutus ATCC 200175]